MNSKAFFTHFPTDKIANSIIFYMPVIECRLGLGLGLGL